MVHENKLHLFCTEIYLFCFSGLLIKCRGFPGNFFFAGEGYFSVTRFDSCPISKLLVFMHRVVLDELCCARGKADKLAEIPYNKETLA